jgi:EAL domain-containing protein (putative c-di-GMP-specific phosphodiesterase class I)
VSPQSGYSQDQRAETLDFLTTLGCDEAQGYLFSAPVPIEKVPEVIAEWAAERTLAA